MTSVSDTDTLYTRIYESGRQRGLAECPCGQNDGAADLLTYEDGYDEGVEDGRRQGATTALVAVLVLGLVALGLRGRG